MARLLAIICVLAAASCTSPGTPSRTPGQGSSDACTPVAEPPQPEQVADENIEYHDIQSQQDLDRTPRTMNAIRLREGASQLVKQLAVFPELTALAIEGTVEADELAVAGNFPALTTLNLSNAKAAIDAYAATTLGSHARLRHVSLGLVDTDEAAWNAFCRQSSIASLELNQADTLDNSFLSTSTKLHDLRVLRLHELRPAIWGLGNLKTCSRLTTLALINVLFTSSQQVGELSCATSLQQLSLVDCYGITDETLATINLPELKAITLVGAQVTTSSTRTIASMTLLERLHFYDCRQLEFDNPEQFGALLDALSRLEDLELHRAAISTEHIEILSRHKRLRHLGLLEIELTNADLKAISAISTLESLSFQSQHASDIGISYLRDLTNLRFLAVGTADLNDAGMRFIADIVSLEALELQFVNILPPDSWAELARLPNFRRLDLRHLRRHDLAGRSVIGVINEDLKYLAEVNSLAQLVLSGELLTGDALGHLKTAASLSELVLVGCPNVDPQAVTQLSRNLPRCVVKVHN